MNRTNKLREGVDMGLIGLYLALVIIGMISIFIVQYRETDNVSNIILKGSKDYGKQIRFFLVCIVIAVGILITDSKFFTATANLQYAAGILLILLTFVFHSSVKGSNSFLGFGRVRLFQPAELTKLFSALALAKFLGVNNMDLGVKRNQLTATAIVLVPAVLTILQNETGLALVYFSMFLAMYREGMPGIYLVYFAAVAVVTVAALLVDRIYIIIALVLAVLIALFVLKGNYRQRKKWLPKIITFTLAIAAYAIVALPFIYNNVLKPHHKTRVADLLGIEAPAFAKKSSIAEIKTEKAKKKAGSNYNVEQSKIAIGSGGLLGKGPLNNTQTRLDFVPEQHTDFIFCSVAEAFGFVGATILLVLYFALLWRLVKVAERQRSAFSRVFTYCIASILFFHIFVNIAMTLGLAPVIGIPLPFISYGGASLITFTAMLFIVIKLDADRQMSLR